MGFDGGFFGGESEDEVSETDLDVVGGSCFGCSEGFEEAKVGGVEGDSPVDVVDVVVDGGVSEGHGGMLPRVCWLIGACEFCKFPHLIHWHSRLVSLSYGGHQSRLQSLCKIFEVTRMIRHNLPRKQR